MASNDVLLISDTDSNDAPPDVLSDDLGNDEEVCTNVSMKIFFGN